MRRLTIVQFRVPVGVRNDSSRAASVIEEDQPTILTSEKAMKSFIDD